MAFTATRVGNPRLVGGILEVVVEYTDGTRTFQEKYRTSVAQDSDWLNRLVANRVRELADLETFAAALGPIAAPKPPVTPPPPTQAELDRAAYSADIRLLRQLQLAKDVTVDKVAQADIDVVALRLKTNFKPGYEDLYGGRL